MTDRTEVFSQDDAVDSTATTDVFAESEINLSLLDPSHYGWTAAGGIAELLTPHERAKQKNATKQCTQSRSGKKRGRKESFVSWNTKDEADQEDSTRLNYSIHDSMTLDRFVPPLGSVMKVDSQYVTAVMENLGEADQSSSNSAEIAVIRFKALQSDGTGLDIHTYHRGRESSEIRDQRTGDLIFDDKIIASTNFDSDSAPKSLVATVSIIFPLEDDEDDDEDYESNLKPTYDPLVENIGLYGDEIIVENQHVSRRSMSSKLYTDTIQWNLADPKTPTPIAFASKLAVEFGLSYVQTIELADSIQQQLQVFVRENCSYSAPIALRGTLSSTPSQHLLELKPNRMIANLFGGVTGALDPGGSCRLANPKSQQHKKPSRNLSLLSTILADKVDKLSDHITPNSSSKSSNTKVVNAKLACEKTTNKEKTTNRGTSSKTKRGSDLKRKQKCPQTDLTKAEEIYYDEVRARLLTESIINVRNTNSGNLLLYGDHFCHKCSQQRPVCAVFACCTLSHAYCEMHLAGILQMPMSDEQSLPLSLHYCPICSLSCDCPECIAKLDYVALDFKTRCLEQKTSADAVMFENLLEYCKLLNHKSRKSNGGNSLQTKHKRAEHVGTEISPIAKAHSSKFPREVADGVDLDHGFGIYYSNIYTANGIIPCSSLIGATNGCDTGTSHEPSCEDPIPFEDGNVDYCNICKKAGNLLCCDFCPRAFHNNCIAALDRDSNIDTWECPSCRREKGVLPEDLLTGETSMSMVATVYSTLADSWDDPDKSGLKILGILCEMIQRLVDYDFGYMFRHPVDVEQVTSYLTVVKMPMDLGTILTNLQNGQYNDAIRNSDSPVDAILVAVLNDIELVWHNCFMFNSEGSAVYRMAEVQRKRAQAITTNSLGHYLQERKFVKESILCFSETCETERNFLRSTYAPPGQVKTGTRQRAKHKILSTSLLRGGKGRPVAVLDPETGRIVKIYTSIQSACHVVNFFLRDLNLPCEVAKDQVGTVGKLRSFISQCRIEDKNCLFGYRWLLLEDLQSKRVAFPRSSKLQKKRKRISTDSRDSHELDLCSTKANSSVPSTFCSISMTDGDKSYIFNSIEESLSFAGIGGRIAAVREQLISLSQGSFCIDDLGRHWRCLGSRSQTISWKKNLNLEEAHNGLPMQSSSDILKVDVVSGLTLMSFGNVETAFHDWIDTIDAAVMQQLDRSVGCFRSQYLNQPNTVDGICWREREASEAIQFRPCEIGAETSGQSRGNGVYSHQDTGNGDEFDLVQTNSSRANLSDRLCSKQPREDIPRSRTLLNGACTTF